VAHDGTRKNQDLTPSSVAERGGDDRRLLRDLPRLLSCRPNAIGQESIREQRARDDQRADERGRANQNDEAAQRQPDHPGAARRIRDVDGFRRRDRFFHDLALFLRASFIVDDVIHLHKQTHGGVVLSSRIHVNIVPSIIFRYNLSNELEN